jgi:ankyrin repeat protein
MTDNAYLSSKHEIFAAIKQNDIKGINRLVSTRNVDNQDEQKNTILYNAVKNGSSQDTIRALLEHKADPSINCDIGLTPIHAAIEFRNIDIVKILVNILPSLNVNRLLTENQSSVLHSAAIGIKNGNIAAWDSIEFLIKEKNMSPFIENVNKQSARDILCNINQVCARRYDDIIDKNYCRTNS